MDWASVYVIFTFPLLANAPGPGDIGLGVYALEDIEAGLEGEDSCISDWLSRIQEASQASQNLCLLRT
jgi:hypothetical protein